ncbi:hypothetical protein ELQ37_19230, partial [Pseudomonas aeruginosa]
PTPGAPPRAPQPPPPANPARATLQYPPPPRRPPRPPPPFSGPGHTSGFPDASPIEYEFILIGNPPNLRLPRFRSSRKRP